MNNSSGSAFATDSLESLRRRLLDLTARNRLLNFTHGRAGNVRVIDELPDELHRLLLSETELHLAAVPDPSREQLIRFGYIRTDPESGLDERLKKDPAATEWARASKAYEMKSKISTTPFFRFGSGCPKWRFRCPTPRAGLPGES